VEVGARVLEIEALARPFRLERLRDGEAQLEFWTDRPAEWLPSRDADGGEVIAASADGRRGSGAFGDLLRAPRRAPLFRLSGREGGGAAASDPLGLSTVYWREFPESVVLASRSGLLVPPADRRIDLLAAYHFLNFSVVPSPFSILAGVSRLAPGTCLTVGERIERETFWDLTYAPPGAPPSASLAEALRESVRAGVVRTVEGLDPARTGAFLSGGTDSTTVAAMAAETLQSELDVFSIIYDDPAFSEERFVRVAARRFPFRTHSFLLDERSFVSALPAIQEAYDEPYANASVYAAYYCFEMARQCGKTVLLAGDGGDEIFGGNQRYATNNILSAYHAIPPALRAAWEKPLARMKSRAHVINRVRKAIRRANLANPDRFYADDEFASAHWEEMRGPAFAGASFAPDASAAYLRDLYHASGAPSELDRLLYLDMKGTIADNDLRKITGCGAIFGIEPRFPLLSLDLVEFANHLPARLKVRGLRKRYLFKQAMKGFLPRVIIRKRKHGMGLPLGRWLRGNGPLSEYVRSRLFGGTSTSLFNPRFLEQIWIEHRTGQWDRSPDLWRIVVLADWSERHAHGARPRPEPVEQCVS
jgi:asparagine synthase (glutamine-hydrolysing)